MSVTIVARTTRSPRQQNTLALVIPDEVVQSFESGWRPRVVATIHGHSWRTTIARMGGESLVGIAKKHRDAAGLSLDLAEVEITLELDTAPRTVEVPDDLAAALREAGVSELFAGMSYTHRKEWVREIEGAKRPETRERRIGKAVAAARERSAKG